MRRRSLALTTLTLTVSLTAAACGGSDEPASTPGPEKQAPTASVSSSKSPSPPTEKQTATCTLKGKKPAKVTLDQSDDGLTLAFDGQPTSVGDTVLYSATVFDKAGETGVQLGMKFQGGKQIGYFVFDFTTNEQANLDGSPEVTGKRVSGLFPTEALGDLVDAGPASWSAALSVDGNDLGTCPDGIDGLPFPG